jgi:hypothetical protein
MGKQHLNLFTQPAGVLKSWRILKRNNFLPNRFIERYRETAAVAPRALRPNRASTAIKDTGAVFVNTFSDPYRDYKNPEYTSISSTVFEQGGTTIQKVTLTIDGNSLSLGVLPIVDESSHIYRMIDGSPTEAFSFLESYSLPSSDGNGECTIAISLPADINPPLKKAWSEPVYAILSEEPASLGYFEFIHSDRSIPQNEAVRRG